MEFPSSSYQKLTLLCFRTIIGLVVLSMALVHLLCTLDDSPVVLLVIYFYTVILQAIYTTAT